MSEKFKYINLGYIEEISGGDKDFKKELIQIFLKQVPEFISNMHQFLTNNEKSNLAKEAHTAKSSALIFSMEDTGKTLKRIQLLAEDNQIEPIPGLLTQVEKELNGATKELTSYLNEL
jgi:HPt (histidine-containing phosphotransfer) domain-containing protein